MRFRIGTSFALAGVLVMLFGSMGAAPVPATTETVVTGSELDEAMGARADEEAAARETILNLLDRAESREAAGQLGVDLDRIQAAVPLLSGEELEEVAAQARLVNESISGGDEKVVIGTTVLIIILLIVIILVSA